MKYLSAVWMVIMFIAGDVHSQLAPVYSQYIINQAVINPAYAGANNCLNATAMYRRQWSDFGKEPKTVTFSAHTPLKKRALAIGLNVVYDQYGVTYNNLVEGLLAYRININKHIKLSFGLGAGIIMNRNSLSDLQLNDKGDDVFTNNLNSNTPNFSFGTYLENKKFYIGFSALNLNRNLVRIPTFVYQQPLYLIAGYHYKLSGMFLFSPSFLIKKINKNPLQADLNLLITYNRQFKIGAAWRTKNAVYALMFFQLNDQLQLGYSYDYTFSALGPIQRGSHEISVQYLFQYKTQTVDIKTFQ